MNVTSSLFGIAVGIALVALWLRNRRIGIGSCLGGPDDLVVITKFDRSRTPIHGDRVVWKTPESAHLVKWLLRIGGGEWIACLDFAMERDESCAFVGTVVHETPLSGPVAAVLRGSVKSRRARLDNAANTARSLRPQLLAARARSPIIFERRLLSQAEVVAAIEAHLASMDFMTSPAWPGV